MGVKVSPDVTQNIMEEILSGIDCSIYMDDVGIWTNGSFKEHLSIVEQILWKFAENNLKYNPLKCSWAVKETTFLGYWMTPTGIKPWKKQIKAILNLREPKNNTDVWAFIGAVNHYKSLWPRCAHVLAPLSELTGQGKFNWTTRHQQSFNAMKAILCANALNAYPDYSKPFHLHTDTSDFQLGAAIIQDINGIPAPIVYYSKKLDKAQRNYTTVEIRCTV